MLDAQIHGGDQSDYIRRTREAVLSLPCGWHCPQDLYWDKVHATPSGSRYRLRKRIVPVLWFSRTVEPHVNKIACGKWSDRIGADVGNQDPRYSGSKGMKSGIARITDMFVADATQTDRYKYKGITHRATFPAELVRQCLLTFAPPKSVVCDLFAGAGTTLVGAQKYGYPFVGCDCVQEFVDMINHRLLHDKKYSVTSTGVYQVASENGRK